jgi:hypothetical protein
VAEAAIGFGDRASPFFDDRRPRISPRPRHAEFRENAKPEAGFKLKPALDQGRCRRWIAVSTLWSNGGREAVCHCREDFTSTIIALTIGRLSQDLRGDAIRTQSSLINGPR